MVGGEMYVGGGYYDVCDGDSVDEIESVDVVVIC